MMGMGILESGKSPVQLKINLTTNPYTKSVFLTFIMANNFLKN